MLKRKLLVKPNELNKILLRELVGLNGMKIKNGTLYFNDIKLDFNNISVKLNESDLTRLNKLFVKKDEQVLIEIEEALKNDLEEVIEFESDYIDNDIELRTISFKGIKIVLMYSVEVIEKI